MKTYQPKNEDLQRLDSVAAELTGLSRTKIQKAIKSDLITVNGEKALVKTQVNHLNSIEIDDTLFEERKRDTTPPELNILFENDDVIVVNKPAGLLVHDAPGNTDPTLVDGLVAYAPEIASVGDDPQRPGIVHRLDKFASGVLITAKNQESFEFLKQQFKDRKTTKKYSVLVEGKMEKQTDTIDFSIERSKSTGRMAAKPESQGGKTAITHYDIVKQYPHHALLDVRIETGRTHQIRVHMFSIGHPVVGDTLYRIKGKTPRDIGRLFLHARELTIALLGDEEMTFSAPLPKVLEDVLNEIPKL